MAQGLREKCCSPPHLTPQMGRMPLEGGGWPLCGLGVGLEVALAVTL